ncbi:VWA domain-containing protein [bacterium]|nr:VWA domain-containing protein [bacterium]
MLEFSRPIWLLLLLALPAMVWLALRLSYASLGPFQKWISLALRIIIWTLLVFALAGVQFVRMSDRVSVVVAVDTSDSIDEAYLPPIEQQLEEARKTMKKDDSLGRVYFGAEALLEFLPVASPSDTLFATRTTQARSNYTDISRALQLAVASFPANAQKRLVLVTDGNENIGNSLAEARVARDNGVELVVVEAGSRLGAEVVLASLEAPTRASLGETVNVRFMLDSNVATPADISLIRNGQHVDTTTINVRPGKEVYDFPVQIDQSGFFTYELAVEPQLDSITENNRAYAFSVVGGQPRLLFASCDPNDLNYLPPMLNAHNIQVDAVPPSGIPYSFNDFMLYDGIIFSDIAAYDITEDQMKMIQTMVRDYGRGFLMIGGDKSFGPGGYFDTPIEETLPVDMDFRRKKITPSTLVICLIDKSGSMGATVGGQTKIDMAKESCKAVVRLQTERDYVAVMGFDAVGQWVVRPTRGINKAETLAQISSMQAGGGTDLYPALAAAYDATKDLPVQIRHVIVFTDGMVAPADFQGLTSQMKADNYTISTVAFGTDADVPFLKDLARLGDGNAYEANSLHDLPRIFTREVFLANKATLVEEPFAARPTSEHQLISAIPWGSAPALYGYVSSTPKETAQVPLLTHKDDPLLAVWNYGLGKSAAFTSDAKNRWARNWLDWSGYERFWTGMARWLRSDLDSSGVDVTTSISGNQGLIQVSALGEEGEFVNYGQLEARITDPELESQTFQLDQVGPGQYEGRFTATENGNYFINVVQLVENAEGQPEVAGAQAAGLSVSYSPEYKNLQANNFLLNHLQSSSLAPEGLTLPGLFTEQRKPQRRLEDAWELFTLIALCLWLLDVAVRRLVLDWSEVRLAMAGALEGASVQRAKRTSESLAGLLAVKSRARHHTQPAQTAQDADKRRQALQAEAQARERVTGEQIQAPAETPAGRISAAPRPGSQPSSSLSDLRRRMDTKDTKRPVTPHAAEITPPGPIKPTPTPPSARPARQEDLTTREMTSRLLKRKQHGRDRPGDEDGS